jgi:hypothetical protein
MGTASRQGLERGDEAKSGVIVDDIDNSVAVNATEQEIPQA